MIKIAIIGFGAMGKNHYRVLKKFAEDIEITAIVDNQKNQLNAIPPEFQGERLSAVEEIKEMPEAVVIATPTSFHYSQAKFFLERKIPVFLEKPITADEGQGRELVELSRKNDVYLAVNHIERFNPAVEFLLNQRGQALFADIQRLGSFSLRSLDVDVLQDLMIHDIDIVLKLESSKLKDIHGVGVAVVSNRIDLANVRLEFESGFVANITASRVSQQKVRKLRLFKKGCYYSVDYQTQKIKVLKLENNIIKEEVPEITYQEPLYIMWQKFIRSLKEKKFYAVSAADALQALIVINSIRSELKVVQN